MNTSPQASSKVHALIDWFRNSPDPMHDNGPRWQRVLRQCILCIQYTLKGFSGNNLMLRASALTFTTVLSIVPFLAVAFSVLKGMDFQNTDTIRELLLSVSAGREQVVDAIIGYIDNTNVKTLGAVGTAFLFLTVISLLSNIESTFNSIWHAPQGRSIFQKVTNYISICLVVPVLLVTAISFTASLQSSSVVQGILSYSAISYVYLALIKLVPHVSVWIAMLLLYSFMPNTRVKPLPALGGAIIAGTCWLFAQWLYMRFQIGAGKYNAIYGSFAQFPLFLIWMQLSWTIILLGAQLSFVFQHRNSLDRENRYSVVSQAERMRVSLAVLLEMAASFMAGRTPASLEEISSKTRLPSILVRNVLSALRTGNLVAPLADEEKQDSDEEKFTLIRSPESIRLSVVLGSLANDNAAGIDLNAPGLAVSNQIFERLEASLENMPENATLAELASKMTAEENRRNGES